MSRGLLIALFLAFALPASADGTAVVGSFLSEENAERRAREVLERMGMDASIVVIEIESRRWHRVVVADPDARSLVGVLRAAGFDAFFASGDVGARSASRRPARKAPPARTDSIVASAPPPAIAHPDGGPDRGLDRGPDRIAPAVFPVSDPTRTVSGDQSLKGNLNGVPMHYINVPTYSHDAYPITLDGAVDEAVWAEVAFYDNMLVAVPGTGEPGEHPTELRLFATEKGLYASAVMYQPPETLVSRLSKRDEYIDRDTFGITLDTTGEGHFAYWFILGLGDSMMDGKVLPERRYSSSWDGTWIGKSAKRDDGWSVEAFFPWSMMNVPERDGVRQVGFVASRQVAYTNERYQWPGHPYSSAQFVTAMNSMSVEGVQPRQQYSIIPYASQTADLAADDQRTRAGFDAAWRPSPELELTASVAPDFGAVEVDDVVLNLTAFETFFPEKRLFFLEGSEVFESTPRSDFGMPMRTLNNENFATTSRRVFMRDFMPAPISIVNTRRIGGTATQVDRNDATPLRGERDRPTDLLGAAKLTGSMGKLRYGILAALEDEVEWRARNADDVETMIRADGRDVGVARLLYSGAGANRWGVGYIGTYVGGSQYDAAVHGLDANFTSGNGRWIADLQLVSSDVDDESGQGAVFDLRYAPGSNFQHKLELDYFDENIDLNDLGFLRRNDYSAAQYVLLYAAPKPRGWLRGTRGAVAFRQEYNLSKGQVVDSGIYWRNIAVLPWRNTLRSGFGYFPERWEDLDSRGNGAYRTSERWWWTLLLSTDASKMFSWSAGLGGTQENLGDWTDALKLGVTIRPSDRISADIDINYKRRDGWLVYQGDRNFGAYHGTDWQPSFKLTWFVAPRHQVGAQFQWAGVRVAEQGFYAVPAGDGELVPAQRTRESHDFTVSLLTAQLRYRWEIAPLTDLFVVYNVGNSLPNQTYLAFDDLFEDTWQEPVIDAFIAKLRWRFGN